MTEKPAPKVRSSASVAAALVGEHRKLVAEGVRGVDKASIAALMKLHDEHVAGLQNTHVLLREMTDALTGEEIAGLKDTIKGIGHTGGTHFGCGCPVPKG